MSKFENLNAHVKKMDEVYFRGDSRDPKEIFEFGFQRRGSTYDYYKKHQKLIEPTMREITDDIEPASAVCVTANMDCAPIFPIEREHPNTETWIYVVQGSNMFETHAHQQSALKFAQELAVRDIPSGDVICAIKCKRFINVHPEMNRFSYVDGMHYQLTGDIIWNPKLQNEFETRAKVERQQKIIHYVEERKNKYIACPIPRKAEDLLHPRTMNDGKPLVQLTEREHQDHVSLIAFYQQISQGKREEAFTALEGCSNINQPIPGTKVNPFQYSVRLSPAEQLDRLNQYFSELTKKRDSMFGLAFSTEQKDQIKNFKDRYMEIVNNHSTKEVLEKVQQDINNSESLVNCHRDLISFGSTKTAMHLKSVLRKIKEPEENSLDNCSHRYSP